MAQRAALADGNELAQGFHSSVNPAETSAQNQVKESAVATGCAIGSDVDQPDHMPAPDEIRPMSMPSRPRILLVGDKGFTSLLKYIIEGNGFDCALTDNVTEAIASASNMRTDLIAVDDVSCGDRVAGALERLHRAPATRDVPTLIMAGMSPHPDEACVQMDRASFILKPFLPDIFIDRLHGLLREPACSSPRVLRFADIVMESEAHRVSRGSRCIRLCPVEYRILQHLLESPRKVFSREQILSSIRAHTQENAVRSIDVHISRIRKALCERGEPNYIRTVRGLGYSVDFAPDGPATYVPRPEPADRAQKLDRSDRIVPARR
ncbi:winged helix-turn-helix transcriptional regulator [Bradyrhizobium sp. HKCCYLS20291]|uniref:winged helix-turn-helix transcriptional regulator n=1 Tax=Bradyrhizobium sp. HKCCYLS20291 TaxID=3420766 RepID=UPI003EC086EA